MYKQDFDFEIYKRIYKSRDLELSFFWQRAIFLSAFIFICFTAYGTFQMKLFYTSDNTISYIGTHITNLISVFICFCGLILSYLWVFMFKGSKNAYEVYEKKLNEFIEYKYKNVEAKFLKPADLNLVDYKNRYSLSKINIFLGYFSAFIFFTLIVIHLYIIIISQKHILLTLDFKVVFFCALIFCVIVFFSLSSIFRANNKIRLY